MNTLVKRNKHVRSIIHAIRIANMTTMKLAVFVFDLFFMNLRIHLGSNQIKNGIRMEVNPKNVPRIPTAMRIG